MRRVLLTVGLVGLVGLLGAAKCGSTPPPPLDCTTTGSAAHTNLRYAHDAGVTANLQSLDLYVPQRAKGCAATPLIAYVHGGAFVTGDKSNKITDKVKLLHRRRVGVREPELPPRRRPRRRCDEWRVPGRRTGHRRGARLPRRSHADDYALDPHDIMLLGHSAGAFLVSLVSTDGSFVEGAGIEQSDIVCTAPLDTTYDIPAQVATGGNEEAMYRNTFGDDPAVWKQASPPNNVAAGKDIPAFHIVTRGTPARVAQSQAFATTLTSAGFDADAQVVRGLTHEEVNAAVGQAGETTVTKPLMDFFHELRALTG